MGCNSAPLQEPTEQYVILQVQDTLRRPIDGLSVTMFAWYADRDTIVGGTSDSTGLVVFQEPLPSDGLDSLLVRLSGRECTGFGRRDTLVIFPEGAQMLSVIATGSLLPMATIQPGEFCARSLITTYGSMFWLVLQIDSVQNPLVYGRWKVLFNFTRVPDEGTFLGVVTEGALGLSLSSVESWLGYCEVRYRFVAPIHDGNIIGAGHLREEIGSCPLPDVPPVQLYTKDFHGFP